MEYNVTFMVDKTTIAKNNIAPIFDSYEWWIDLVTEALKNTDEFEMRLWEDDMEGIQSGQKFGKLIPNNRTKEIVYRGKLVPEVEEEIITNHLTKEGYIKWFTLNLKRGSEYIFTSAHYGDETLITVDTKEQVNSIQKWAEKYPIIWRVDVFECE
ncbi:MAG: hypothetical protein GX238_10905 [Epulopiscium sp.]|nr:hypothetical protein [Candidatus Epulonipiscium sp.]